MTRRIWLLSALALVACEAKTDQAVDPAWGKQPCGHCAMIVSDHATAAQLVANGDRVYFDDVGCMVAWLDERKVEPAHAWVRKGETWVDAKSARYAPGARTPMDYGFVGADTGVTYAEMSKTVLAKVQGGEP